ncbi:MAG: hypothetical protein JO122_12065 [Acetobacteraceae bacterium]|nr:hypothetical protein [Acetobacteraceae bacterium]
MKLSDPSKRGSFVPSGIKKHRLWQSDTAVILVTEMPSEITYTIDYFEWHTVLKSVLPEPILKEAVLRVSNQEELIIDYDQKKLYAQPRTSDTTASSIARDLHQFFQTGILPDEPGGL